MNADLLGWVVSFIPEPVVIGFTAGAATTIISSQVKNFLGLSGPKGSGFLGYWKAIFNNIGTISLGDCLMGGLSFIALLLLRVSYNISLIASWKLLFI
jgi:MFS superfamily sulfate permease-like transporter